MTGCTDENTVELLFDKMYRGFVEEVDAVDNGISQYEGEPRYASRLALYQLLNGAPQLHCFEHDWQACRIAQPVLELRRPKYRRLMLPIRKYR